MNKMLMMVLVMVILSPTVAAALSSPDYRDGTLTFLPGDDQTIKYDKNLKTFTLYEVKKKTEWKITTDLFLELTPAQIKKLDQTGRVEVTDYKRLVITKVFPWIECDRIFSRRVLVLENNTVSEKTADEVPELVKENRVLGVVFSILLWGGLFACFLAGVFACRRYSWVNNPSLSIGWAVLTPIALTFIWPLMGDNQGYISVLAFFSSLTFVLLLIKEWILSLHYRFILGAVFGLLNIFMTDSDKAIRWTYLGLSATVILMSGILWAVWRYIDLKRTKKAGWKVHSLIFSRSKPVR